MKIDLSRFRETFFAEAAELLDELEAGLLRLEQDTTDAETLHGVFRAAHSIKGSAGMLDLRDIMRFTHELETVLDALRSGQQTVDAAGLALLLRAADLLRALVIAEQSGGQAPADAAAVAQALAALSQASLSQAGRPAAGSQTPAELETSVPPLEAPPGSPGTGYRLAIHPSPDAAKRGLDPLLLLRELGRLGRLLRSEVDCTRLPELSALDRTSVYLSWRVEIQTAQGEAAIAELTDWFGVDATVTPVEAVPVAPAPAPPPAATPAPPPAAAGPAQASRREAPAISSTVRVAVDKIDQLVSLAGELAVAHSMASEVAGNFRPERWPELEMALAEIGRQVWLLQQSVMGVRMLPASELFRKLPRLVHELQAVTGKQLTLECEGEDAEMDKSVAERLADPLTHLVRNAADHGIEMPAERLAAGKPERGTVRVRALHEAGDVVVEVADDGRGLNAERIRAKAIERGLLDPSATPGEQALYRLIFEPGFSTAERVTSLSGRGVGMDVVKRNVVEMGGSITVDSRAGMGTVIRIRLPLTLAILDGLLVQVSGVLILIPIAAVIKSLEAGPMKEVPGWGPVTLMDDEPVPVAVASAVLNLAPLSASETGSGLAVALQKGGRRVAFLVDELVGRQQVIVRSLEDHYVKVPGLLGASILGDGQVALILDPGWVIDRAWAGVATEEVCR